MVAADRSPAHLDDLLRRVMEPVARDLRAALFYNTLRFVRERELKDDLVLAGFCGKVETFFHRRGDQQSTGSGTAETFVLDNAVKQLSGPEGRSYLPSGFRIFTVNSVPKAPPKIDPSSIREE